MQVQKDILFYSNLCDFSKEVLATLVKHQLKDNFLLVCVDNKNLKLPSFVECVPLIYTASKKLFADDHLMNYIKSKISSSSLQPYSLVGMNTGSLSESFSFLDNGDEFGETSARNYNFLGIDQKIYAPEESSENNGEGSKKLEAFMASRDNDIQKIYGNGNGNGAGGFNRTL